jgi:hypothetical protein
LQKALTATTLSPPRLAVKSSGTNSGAPFQMQLFGDPDKTYVIQATTNCVNWTSISTNHTDTSGIADVADSQSSRFTLRFYRGMLAP